MTLDDFLIKFKEVVGETKWKIYQDGRIRSEEGYCYLGKQLGCNLMGVKTLCVRTVIDAADLMYDYGTLGIG